MSATTTRRLSRSEIHIALKGDRLVGVTAAAHMLGIKTSNFRRDAAPHLLEIPVQGSASVYFVSEVRELARKRGHRRQTNGNG